MAMLRCSGEQSHNLWSHLASNLPQTDSNSHELHAYTKSNSCKQENVWSQETQTRSTQKLTMIFTETHAGQSDRHSQICNCQKSKL